MNNMTAFRVYLLSVGQLYDSSYGADLQNRVMLRLDAHRLEKVRNTRAEKAKCLAMGAGLLLQLAVYERKFAKYGVCDDRDSVYDNLISLNVSEALERLGEQEVPIQIAYRYDANGKPDFDYGDLHFNLSHSGEYVCCAVSEEKIGIDIQEMRPLRNLNVAERFFSDYEYDRIVKCGDDTEKARIFYSIWVRKESYAKLTGEGIASIVEKNIYNVNNEESLVEWVEYPAPQGYLMALCRYKFERGH